MNEKIVNIDFTIKTYRKLVEALKHAGYSFQTYHDFINQPEEKVILLRHDVDARKEHSLQFAKIQHEMDIVGTYYFRMVPESFDEEVIREIASMGHEIGYHYEDMDFAKGDIDQAHKLAKKHLAQLREVAEIKTICMHGSPRSPYDNKEVWNKYNYRDLGIIAEPYFDTDFSKVLYLTDTGRRWDGDKVSIRDKVSNSGEIPGSQDQNPKGGGIANSKLQISDSSTNQQIHQSTNKPLTEKYSFHSTRDIITACKAVNLPNQVMMNFHPQRWTNDPVLWMQELVWQNVKNVVKWGLVRFR